MSISNDAFIPNRGTEEQVASQYPSNGNLYFTSDTYHIYCDMNGERKLMGNTGITFVYGSAAAEAIIADAVNGTYAFPKSEIQKNETYKQYVEGSIIVNSDGTFYKILSLNDISYPEHAICAKILVAGSGGGGGGTGASLFLVPVTEFPNNNAAGLDVTGTFLVRDDLGTETTATIIIQYYQAEGQINYDRMETFQCTVGSNFSITLSHEFLHPGQGTNYIVVTARTNDGRVATRIYPNFSIFDVKFEPTSSWNPKVLVRDSQTSFAFPYNVTATTTPPGMRISLVYTLDGVYNYSPQTQITALGEGSHNIYDLFNSNVTTGGHTLHVQATMTYTNMPEGGGLIVGDFEYGIGWSQQSNTDTPIIWSPYPSNNEVSNYTVIDIPYMVFDPLTQPIATVSGYINGDEIFESDITYSSSATDYTHWKISEYNVGEVNEFILQCRGTLKTFYVTIVDDASVDLSSIKTGCALYLNASGRSNAEKATRRSIWQNKSTQEAVTGAVTTGDITLSNFNWYNNGWIETNDISALRVSNGASVTIPLVAMSSQQAQPRTYEFDFKVRNATDYSKLVNYEELTDEFGNVIYDEDGKSTVIKTVSTSGAGAFLTYYANNKGIMLGTQEAFFGFSPTDVLNIRYTDEERVKISFTVDPVGSISGGRPLVYAYINGVLTGVCEFASDADFNAGVNQITINSTYCDVDLYTIRVYDTNLSYGQITQNWVGDASTLEEKWNRYNKNQAILRSNKISYDLVKNAGLLPVMVLQTYNNTAENTKFDDKLPYYKGDKKHISIRYYDPDDASKNFHADNINIDVQGTSSQGYPRRNYKIKLKQSLAGSTFLPFHFETWDGIEANKNVYVGGDSAISKVDIGNGNPETTFCLKADYMDSSSTHNTCLADFVQALSASSVDGFNIHHPLIKDFDLDPAEYSYLRTTVYGYPILLFHEAANGTITYIGKYNFNLDKGATTSFGFKNEEISPYVADTTFEDLCECWEVTQNQAGLGKFQVPAAAVDQGLTGINRFWTTYQDALGNSVYEAYKHFEMRQYPGDMDQVEDDLDAGGAAAHDYYNNLAEVWNWTASTDVEDANPMLTFNEPVYYKTLSASYNETDNITYYTFADGAYVEQSIVIELLAKYVQNDDEPSLNLNSATFVNKITQLYRAANENADPDQNDLMGTYHFTLVDGAWQYDGTDQTLADWGLSLVANYEETEFDISVGKIATGFSTNLYEKFEADTERYRLCKFKNEFTQHWDLDYCLFYYVMTELLLLYDSRQKNMMLASWGPQEIGGDFIWYPIFYDMDTQLGVNNSGQVYWDYDVDATPQDGSASIFSGNGSILWANMNTCFQNEIQKMYRGLRAGALTYNNLVLYYDTNGSDQWSETMKNIDADYKYIAPADETRGYVDTEGETQTTASYFYCLQGDRKLNRDAFFRNRLNYLDSQWLGGTYNPEITKSQIKMRYNLNDAANTSDSGIGALHDGDAVFTIKPYLSQYVSVVYDETATIPQKFLLSTGNPITVQPPTNISERSSAGTTLSQQLAYIRGPEYLSDLGDLSSKYLNEFDCTPAKRLRSIIIGKDDANYHNDLLSSDFKLGSGAADSTPKELLETLDISNITRLSNSLDISGCTKLKTFKARGTSLSDIIFASGNLLEKVYLPETVTAIKLIKPLSLNRVITNSIPATNENGLFIQGLTSNFANDTDISLKCRISWLQIEESKLGFDSYELFNYLYKVKSHIIDGSVIYSDAATNNNSDLSIQLTNVQWSEYIAVDSEATYDSNQTYYVLTLANTYEELVYTPDNWYYNLLDGKIYTKNTELTNNITGVTALTRIINEFDNVAYSKNDFHFKSITDDTLHPEYKVMPKISGRMHINNTSEAPINESDIENTLRASAHFPDLEITANYVTPCPRATFIEYSADDPSVEVILDRQKIANGTRAQIQYGGSVPNRVHYDFIGWQEVTTNAVVAGTKQQSALTLRTNQSIITEEDYTNNNFYTTQALESLYLGADDYVNVIFCAVYRVHGYLITFMNDNELFITLTIPAGSPLSAPNNSPYKDSSNLSLRRCYKFIGWGTTAGATDAVDLSRIPATKDQTFYAVFEEASIYDSPLSADELIYQYTNVGDTYGWAIGVQADKPSVRGKICIPKTLTAEDPTTHEIRSDVPVISILGPALANVGGNTQATIASGFYQNTQITHIFFQGMDGEDIAHAPANIMTIAERAFESNINLVYIDLPSSITSIGAITFAGCPLAEMTSLGALTTTTIGTNAFVNCAHGGSIDTWPVSLAINGGVKPSGGAFSQTGWSQYYIGNTQSPLTVEALDYYNSLSGQTIWNDDIDGMVNQRLANITIQLNRAYPYTINEEQIRDLFFGLISNNTDLDASTLITISY